MAYPWQKYIFFNSIPSYDIFLNSHPGELAQFGVSKSLVNQKLRQFLFGILCFGNFLVYLLLDWFLFLFWFFYSSRFEFETGVLTPTSLAM